MTVCLPTLAMSRGKGGSQQAGSQVVRWRARATQRQGRKVQQLQLPSHAVTSSELIRGQALCMQDLVDEGTVSSSGARVWG